MDLTKFIPETWDLQNPEEKYDILPELINGKNMADFIDADIMAKLDELEEAEDKLIAAGFYDIPMEENTDEMKDLKKLAKKIRTTRKLGILESRFNKTTNRAASLKRPDKKVPRSRLEKTMTDLGLDMTNKDDVIQYIHSLYILILF